MGRDDLEDETWAILCGYIAAGRLDELAAISDKQASLYHGDDFVPLKVDGPASEAFTELFTGGLLYGVHSAADLQTYADNQRKRYEAFESSETNADVYRASIAQRAVARVTMRPL